MFAGCGIPQCYHTLLVLVCFVFQITVCYLDRSQLSPRNQFLFITAVSTQPVAIHHNVIHATSCYSSQLSPRNQFLFSVHNQRDPKLRNTGAQECRPCDLGQFARITQYALFPEWEAPCYQDMRFSPSENAVTTSCLHEGDVEGFIEHLRKII